jgi:hypothetical protein
MPSATIITANSSTSGQTPAISSTRAKVTANAHVHYNVGANPTAYAGNCDVIPAGTTRFINMEGLNNKLAFITATGTAEVTVVTVGYVANSAIPQVQST